jgi:adenosylcobinamide kinase/adenosylcobinamide-phosphate guanylyltransferase
MAGHLTLILGGARSGKSSHALEAAQRLGGRVLFVATAQAFDDEMRERIARHRMERPAVWGVVEAPLGVAAALEPVLNRYDTVVVDCLTLLASNVLLSLPDEASQDDVNRAVLAEIDALVALAAHSTARWIVVSNEVGMGVVPPTRLGRYFQDALGRANQRVAVSSDEVTLLVAGLPWPLKQQDGATRLDSHGDSLP